MGIYPRPWYRAELNEEVEIFGYYTAKDFVATNWHTDYPNAAFIEARYDDELWMARIIARFTDEHIREIVNSGQLTDPRHADYLTRVLIERRDKIIQQYFTKYAPLDRFRLVRRTPGDPTQSLCFEDLAIRYGVTNHRINVYKGRFYGGMELERELGWLQFQPDPEHPHRSCIQLPIGDRRPADLAGAEAPDDDPLRYGVMRVFIYQGPDLRPTSSVYLHFYDLGSRTRFSPGRPRAAGPVADAGAVSLRSPINCELCGQEKASLDTLSRSAKFPSFRDRAGPARPSRRHVAGLLHRGRDERSVNEDSEDYGGRDGRVGGIQTSGLDPHEIGNLPKTVTTENGRGGRSRSRTDW